VSLTAGRGPLSRNPTGRFSTPIPDDVAYIEPYPRRVTAMLGDRQVVDSERVVFVHRAGRSPEYAFPTADVEGVPVRPAPELDGYVTVAWGAVDGWYEEGHPVVGHPRNPYHRIDCLPSTRRLEVEVAGTTIVDTADTIVLYETGLDPRLYVSRSALHNCTIEPSITSSYCPYKGTASYWTVTVGDTVVPDLAWSYEDPIPESVEIRGLLSFYESRATVRHNLPSPAI
jgi:uncharacterized protein (DUF427 family)